MGTLQAIFHVAPTNVQLAFADASPYICIITEEKKFGSIPGFPHFNEIKIQGISTFFFKNCNCHFRS